MPSRLRNHRDIDRILSEAYRVCHGGRNSDTPPELPRGLIRHARIGASDQIENPIERHLGTFGIAVFTGFDQPFGLSECPGIDKDQWPGVGRYGCRSGMSPTGPTESKMKCLQGRGSSGRMGRSCVGSRRFSCDLLQAAHDNSLRPGVSWDDSRRSLPSVEVFVLPKI